MTFLAPGFLVIGGMAAAAIVVLHLITRDRPPQAPLPTARFVPARTERAMTRAMRPADPLLLAVRALLALLVAAAFARPVMTPDRGDVARIVVLDRSRAVADPREAADSALALLRDGDALVVFDSAARVVALAASDTLAALRDDSSTVDGQPGSLSAALVAAQRAGALLRDRADSLELMLISPLVREEIDGATAAIRAQWAGRVRLVQVGAASVAGEPVTIDVRAGADDPLVATAALLGRAAQPGMPVRVVRERPSSSDSAFAHGGAVLIVWPADSAPTGWTTLASGDTVGAIIADSAVLIAPLERRLGAPPGASRIVARWVDGATAATETRLGAGCVRDVGIPVDGAGDLALRAEMQALLAVLAEPCGGRRRFDRIDDSTRALLAGAGSLVSARADRELPARPAPLVPWLLGAALLLALAEPIARRRMTS